MLKNRLELSAKIDCPYVLRQQVLQAVCSENLTSEKKINIFSFNAVFILLEKYFVNGDSEYMRFQYLHMGLFGAFLVQVAPLLLVGAAVEFDVSLSICLQPCGGRAGERSRALVETSGEGSGCPMTLLSELGKAPKVRFLTSVVVIRPSSLWAWLQFFSSSFFFFFPHLVHYL